MFTTLLKKTVKKYLPNRTVPYESEIDKQINTLLQNAWAIGLDDVAILEKEVKRFEQYGAVKVLEFGSGVSTLVFFRSLMTFSESILYSVEADPQWIQKIKASLDSHVADAKKQINFNIFTSTYDDKTGFCFDNLGQVLANTYDLIFVDAPPDTSVDEGRYLLCKKIYPLLNEKGTLIIHDVHRNAELFCFESLKSGFLKSEIINTQKGIGVLSFPTFKTTF